MPYKAVLNIVTFCAVLCANVVTLSAAPPSLSVEPYFRNDYTYLSQYKVFLKVITKAKSWSAARSHCEAEGAGLAVISSEGEAKIVVDMLRAAAPKQTAIWIGVHDIFVEDEFMTVNGEPASDYYFIWSSNQPDNAQDDEDCVGLLKDGKLGDFKCTTKFPFVCKKESADVKLNVKCESHDRAYILGVPGEDRCFKLHLKPKTWDDALQTCIHEQAKLALINSDAEAKLFVEELARHPKETIPGNFNKDVALLGFHDRFTSGEYLTIDGIPLSDTGYEKWSASQPDNANGNEHCGSVFRDALFNDAPCDAKFMFFCEKAIKDPNEVGIFSRFPDETKIIIS